MPHDGHETSQNTPATAPTARARILDRFAGYLLADAHSPDPHCPDSGVRITGLEHSVAGLGDAELVALIAALQHLQARAPFLQDLACAHLLDPNRPDEDDEEEPELPRRARSRRRRRHARISLAAQAATAAHLTEGTIHYRAHRATDLAENFPGTRARAATGLLGIGDVERVLRESHHLTDAARHRLDHLIAGRPDPRTPDDGTLGDGHFGDDETDSVLPEPLRPFGDREWATPNRFVQALVRRVDHLRAQTEAAQRAAADRKADQGADQAQPGGDDEQAAQDQAAQDQAAQDQAAQDQAAQDQAAQDQAAQDQAPADAGEPAGDGEPGKPSFAERWAAVKALAGDREYFSVEFGRDGMAYLSLGGNVLDILTIQAAVDAGRKQGLTPLQLITGWAVHALAGVVPPAAAGGSGGNGGSGGSGAPGGSGGGGGSAALAPRVLITVPLATLMGQSTIPAHLDGYGPFPLDLLQEVWHRSTIRCGVVDAGGTLVALGHSTRTAVYSPSDRLRRFIALNWVHCAFPGCDRSADRCQVDHTIPYSSKNGGLGGGPTCLCNLAPLCQKHHNLKTHTAWSYIVYTGNEHPPGTLEWTSPDGRILYAEPGLPEITSWWPDRHPDLVAHLNHPEPQPTPPTTPQPQPEPTQAQAQAEWWPFPPSDHDPGPPPF